MSNPLVQPKTANPGYNGLGAVFQFVLLMAVFTVVLAAYVGSIMFDKRQTMQVVAELKNDTVPLMVKQLRLARNLDTLRFEADQAIRSDTLERRSQGQFYVSVHARDLDFLTDAVVSSQVDELVYLLKQADDAPTEAYLARWADVSERLKRSADQIALEAIVLGQQSVVTVESDLNESLQASFYLLMVGVVLQLLTLLYVGKVFIRPLKKLGAHLASMGGPESPGAIDLATHTTEIQAIERAVNTLVTTMHDNRQMNRNLQESERLLKREMLNAQQAARAKSDFISNISHEIRTPLSTMAGMLYLLEKSGLTPAQLTRLVLLRQCSNHLNDLITKVLDLSKIEAGMLKLESQVFLFGDVLDESFSLFAVEAAGKKLAYSMQVPADVGSLMLRGDALRIRQIFMNLLSNAIKFTAQGAVVLRAEQLAQTSRQVCLKVSVADTGIGLAASDMTQLFQNFSQVDSSTRRQQGGSGLGLAISSKLAELMSGDMGVSSTMGSGAEFWVTFWLERADSADANSRQQTGVWTQGDAPQTNHVAQQAIPYAEPSDTHKGVVAHLAWLAHKDDPGAVTWLQAHQGVVAEALGQAWPAIQQALETYRLSDAVTLLSQAGISPVPSGEGNDDDDDRPTLMLVDDTPGNISYLSGLLGDVCQLRVATTGERAIELLRGNVQPALVLLDIAMPEQDGFSTLKTIKSDPVLAGTPVMLISASVTLQTVEKATQLGALDLIDRILPPQHLRERVITALQSTVESV